MKSGSSSGLVRPSSVTSKSTSLRGLACPEALVARADAELCPRLPRGELDGTGGVVLLSPIRVLL